MSEAFMEIKSGVGTVIVSRNHDCERILTVKELTTWPATNKIAGMRSFPMETIEGEETHLDALKRALIEEVVIHSDLDWASTRFLGRYEIRQGVVLHAYLLTLSEQPKISPGSFVDEVGDPEWTPVDEILREPADSRTYRPGMLEVIESYRKFLANPETYEPPLIRYDVINKSHAQIAND